MLTHTRIVLKGGRGVRTAGAERPKAAATPIDWQFTTADARTKLRRLYPAMAP
jgi:hypothetical protein